MEYLKSKTPKFRGFEELFRSVVNLVFCWIVGYLISWFSLDLDLVFY